ncbi:MAG: hypothetical protein L6R40_008670 [Gallowayella cf. fulva]|nr:MAG: hypothetical protein L6R40_008670 [Xanthomendoza cf. fulva]
MATAPASRINFFRDLCLGLLNLTIGRLLPALHVPNTDLSNKTAIVTGANSGIGLAIATALTQRGATVHLACRNSSKADVAVSDITRQLPDSVGRVKSLSLDTSSLSSVRTFAQDWNARSEKIDILVHNAGIGSRSLGQDEYTSDGFPLIYVTNFLGSFLLTHLLENDLASDARIILTSSTGQYGGNFIPDFSLDRVQNRLEPGFHTPKASVVPGKVTADSYFYSNTKYMQVAFARLLQQHFDSKAEEAGNRSQKLVYTFTPNFTMTPIFGKLNVRSLAEDPAWWILQATTFAGVAPEQGAATGVWLATTQDEEVVRDGKGGGYFDRMTRRVSKVSVTARDIVERLWIRWEADSGVEWR